MKFGVMLVKSDVYKTKVGLIPIVYEKNDLFITKDYDFPSEQLKCVFIGTEKDCESFIIACRIAEKGV